jgi:hypothetical protein
MVYLEKRCKLRLTLSIVQYYIKVLIVGIRDWAQLLYVEIWDQDLKILRTKHINFDKCVIKGYVE